jgi:hypothetical protein
VTIEPGRASDGDSVVALGHRDGLWPLESKEA